MIILLISIVISCDNFLFSPPKVCLTKNNGYTILGVMQGEGGGVVGGGVNKLYYGGYANG